MAKYDALEHHLEFAGTHVTMTFSEIGDLVGGLPRSAYSYSAWRNNYGSTHPQCRSWSEAGFIASPDLDRHAVEFTRR